MSQENVEIVRSILADWARGDYSSADWADPQIGFILADDPVGPTSTRGLDALGRRWKDFLLAWDHLVTTPERFIDAGDDQVVVFVRFEGRGRASGVPTEGFFGGQLFTLREGKVVRLVLYSSREEALEAAGLSE